MHSANQDPAPPVAQDRGTLTSPVSILEIPMVEGLLEFLKCAASTGDRLTSPHFPWPGTSGSESG